MSIPGWDDLFAPDYDENGDAQKTNKPYFIERPSVLDDGIYDFSVINITQEPYCSDNTPQCESIIADINIEGIKIRERFCLIKNRMNKPNGFLTAVGVKQHFDPFGIDDFYKAIGKVGKCYIGNYARNDGSLKNRIKFFIAPGEDLQMIEWREEVKRRAGYKCEICDNTDNLQAHHKLPKSEFPDRKYDITNGQCLCVECHKKVHAPQLYKTGRSNA